MRLPNNHEDIPRHEPELAARRQVAEQQVHQGAA
jgi:hypothetical protein